MALGESPAAEATEEVFVLNGDEDGPKCQRHQEEDFRDNQRDKPESDDDPEGDGADEDVQCRPTHPAGKVFT